MEINEMNSVETTTETVNPVEETGTAPTTETTALDSDAAVVPEPEQFTCHEGCGFTGPVEAFMAPDLKNLVPAIRVETNQTGPIKITREQMAKAATCKPCADKIKAKYGVRFFLLQWGFNKVASFGKKAEQVAAVVGSPVTSTAPVADADPEATVMVACCACGSEQTRATAFIMGQLGAQLLAAFRLQQGDPNEHRPLVHVSSQMLLETDKTKSLVMCKDCAPLAWPKFAEMAANLREICDLSEKEQEKVIRHRLNASPLMLAIRNFRRTEENRRIDHERQAEVDAARVADEQKRKANIADLFTFKAQERGRNGGGGRNTNGRNGGKQSKRGRGSDE